MELTEIKQDSQMNDVAKSSGMTLLVTPSYLHIMLIDNHWLKITRILKINKKKQQLLYSHKCTKNNNMLQM